MKKILPLILSIIAIPWILCSCYASVNKTTENNTASADASANAANPTVYIDEENAIFVDAGKGNDTSGDGSRNAPFKSISRAMEEGAPGKTIYLADGTYYETIVPINGMQDRPLTIAALPGHTPVCTPTVKYEGDWEIFKDNIYVADFSDIADKIDVERVQLFSDTDSLVEARYPNMGSSLTEIMEAPRAIAALGTDAQTIDVYDQLPDGLTGAKVVVWPGENGVAGWIAYTSLIKSVEGSKLNLEERLDTPEDYIGMNAYSPVPGNPFIITGALSLLDAPGEYWYDAQNMKMYVYMPNGDNPETHIMTVRGDSRAVNALNAEYVNIIGIRFYGGGISMENAIGCRLENCHILFSDHFYASGYASYVLDSSNTVTGSDNIIRRCEFGYSAFNGITIGGNDNIFTDNIVHHSNYCGADFAALYVLKSGNTEISHNTITDSGRVHIYFTINTEYDKCVIRNNYLASHSRLTSDSGAFYTWSCDGGGTRIYNNFVDCGRKTENGNMNKCWDGLYLDNYCSNFIVDHNIVLGGSCGLRTNLSNENTLYANNTVIGSQHGYGIYSYPKDEALTKTTRFYNNLFVALTVSDINYNGTENGENRIYSGNLVDGTVPCPLDPDRRIQSSNNLRGTVILKEGDLQYQPEDESAAIDGGVVIEGITDGYLGEAPDIGAIEKGGQMFSYGASWSIT